MKTIKTVIAMLTLVTTMFGYTTTTYTYDYGSGGTVYSYDSYGNSATGSYSTYGNSGSYYITGSNGSTSSGYWYGN